MIRRHRKQGGEHPAATDTELAEAFDGAEPVLKHGDLAYVQERGGRHAVARIALAQFNDWGEGAYWAFFGVEYTLPHDEAQIVRRVKAV